MIEYYSHNKLEDWKTSFLQMTCKSNEQRKLAFYVMTQPLLFKIDCKDSANRSEDKVFKLFYGYHSFIFLFFTNFAPSILT